MRTKPTIRILLAGPSGQVGYELSACLKTFGEVFALSRQDLDLSCKESIRAAVRSLQPHVIVNAAAYTAVDRAESDVDSAMLINGTAPGILAQEANQQRAILVHYSTDYVFDGSKNSPYTETDAAAPINQYGKSKLAGEENIMAAGGAYFILRTSWVYASRGSNFLLKMLQLGSERESLRVVNDQIGSPTSASVVAGATMAVLQRCGAFDEARLLSGIYHATCGGETSWFEFAQAIFAEARQMKMPGLKVREVFPISTKDFPSACQRPLYSVLSCEKIAQTFSFQRPEWKDELPQVIRKVPQLSRKL